MLTLPVWAKLLWFVGTNAVAFCLMIADKALARGGYWRISEANLLFWAVIGGGFGAKAGQQIGRHKTRKEPFRRNLNAAFALSCCLAVLMVFLPGN